MGCGSSKNKIHVAAATGTIVDNSKSSPKKTIDNSRSISATSKSSRKSAWDKESVGEDGSIDPRGGSATSKMSKHSMDSGFDDKDYLKVITEKSDPNMVKNIEQQFNTPRELELGVIGQACSQRNSAKDKERLEEQRVLATLQQEGLITRPITKAAFGVRFDIVAMDEARNGLPAIMRPPARLAKLEKRRKKKKITVEQIEEKLARAEARRAEQEQQRLAKIQSVTMKSDVNNALDSFASRQKQIVTVVKAKDDQALENRMNKLKEMRDKLKAKQEHAEAVRKRKMLAAAAAGDDDEEEMPKPIKVTDDTPVGVSQEY